MDACLFRTHELWWAWVGAGDSVSSTPMPKSRRRKNAPRVAIPPSAPLPELPPRDAGARSTMLWWKRRWKFAVAVATFVSALVAFLPRVTIEIGDPVDPSNAFSARVSVTNNSIALERAKLSFGFCKIIYGGGPGYGVTLRTKRGNCDDGSDALVLSPDEHNLDRNAKFTVLLKDFMNPPKFGGGDIVMVLRYVPWPLATLHLDWLFLYLHLDRLLPYLHLDRLFKQQFRFMARDDGNGNFRWLDTTIDHQHLNDEPLIGAFRKP
jgi:hypothetical protein